MTCLGRRWLVSLACLWLIGCASLGPPLPPSLELPKAPIDLRAERKGNKVTLKWKIPSQTTDRRSVRYLGETEICRGLDSVLKECGKPVGEAAPPANFELWRKAGGRLNATYVDTLPMAIEEEHPTSFATYAVEVLNSAGKGAGLSNEVHVPLIPTLLPFSDFSAQVVAKGVLITWRCPENEGAKQPGIKYSFRIYRHPISGGGEARVAEIDATQCATGSGATAAGNPANSSAAGDQFLDQNFEWDKTYIYRGVVVSAMAIAGKPPVEVEGDDTPEVKVFANDIFPPAVPSGLQAVFSGPGQQPFIDLIWTPDADPDLAGYNVYRHENNEAPVKLNSELVKMPAFRDTQVAAGNAYFYSVSAVDQHGNESGRSEEASERVP
jgi:hypothetical protein